MPQKLNVNQTKAISFWLRAGTSLKALLRSNGVQGIMRLSTLSILLAATAIAGCTATSASGPSARNIDAQASVKVSSVKGENAKPGVDYAVVDLSSAVLKHVGSTVASTLSSGFGGGKGPIPTLPLGVGDVVQVSIFESQAGGLFIPGDAGSRPGNYITLPAQTIDRDGNISVPYAGKIRATGRTAEDVQADIEERLANRAIEPQALITKVSSRSAQVAVLGDVRAPAKIQVSEAGDRILDVISEAGGLNAPGAETYITLQRRGRSARIHYNTLVNTPAENIYVIPGDTVLVDRERRTFVAFGAAGTNGRFDFEESQLTLSDALAKAGGLLDSRADPSQVFLYRVTKKSFLKELGVDTSRFSSDDVPVIFRANLRDPSMFFATTKFPMQDKDIIYVTNSDATELYKFLDLVSAVPATSANVTSDVLGTRDAIRAF